MRNPLIGIAVGFGLSVAFFTLMANPRMSLAPPEMSYLQFIAEVDGGKIEEVTFQGTGEPPRKGRHKSLQLRAVQACQPYSRPPANYQIWKDIILNFDPRDMF